MILSAFLNPSDVLQLNETESEALVALIDKELLTNPKIKDEIAKAISEAHTGIKTSRAKTSKK
jgi:hypothetical protein